MKGYKWFEVLLLIIITISLSSCYKEDRYVFPEGTYYYEGDAVDFFEGLSIDGLSITFQEITEEVYLEQKNINVIQNLNDKKYYSVLIAYKYSSESEFTEYSYEFLGKELSHNDTYEIVLNIDNENAGITGSLSITLNFRGVIYNTSIGDTAGVVDFILRSNIINGIEENESFLSFPTHIYINEVSIN